MLRGILLFVAALLAHLLLKRIYMPRNPTVLQSEYPYHITARTINKDWFQVPLRDVYDIFTQHLAQVTRDYDFEVTAFVLMSNHFHMIGRTPLANISEIMHWYMGKVARDIRKYGNRINETFAGRHYKCILQTENSLRNTYKYCYRNPVRAGIVERVEDYPFSTLRSLIAPNLCKLDFPISDRIFTESDNILEWLNSAPNEKYLKAFRNGLKGTTFRDSQNYQGKRATKLLRPDQLI